MRPPCAAAIERAMARPLRAAGLSGSGRRRAGRRARTPSGVGAMDPDAGIPTVRRSFSGPGRRARRARPRASTSPRSRQDGANGGSAVASPRTAAGSTAPAPTMTRPSASGARRRPSSSGAPAPPALARGRRRPWPQRSSRSSASRISQLTSSSSPQRALVGLGRPRMAERDLEPALQRRERRPELVGRVRRRTAGAPQRRPRAGPARR